MGSLKSAKRAAALKACMLLHQKGELDDHLQPRKYIVLEEDVNFLFKHYPKEKEPLAGTNKNKRKHKKMVGTHTTTLIFLQWKIPTYRYHHSYVDP